MDFIIIFLLNTVLLILVASITIAIVIYWKNKSNSKLIDDNSSYLTWRFGKIMGSLSEILLNFSLFAHIFVLTLFIKTNNGLDTMDWGAGKVLGYLIFSLVIVLFFLISVPRLICFFQFIAFELKRTIIYLEKERLLKIIYKGNEYVFDNSNIKNAEFHLQRRFSNRQIEAMDYIKMTTDDNISLIMTSLLIEVYPLPDINSVLKGIKKTEFKKTFNFISKDKSTII